MFFILGRGGWWGSGGGIFVGGDGGGFEFLVKLSFFFWFCFYGYFGNLNFRDFEMILVLKWEVILYLFWLIVIGGVFVISINKWLILLFFLI